MTFTTWFEFLPSTHHPSERNITEEIVHTKGREVLLILEKDIGPALLLACDYGDTMHMAKTDELV
jgi:hypothetical protein